MVLPVAFSGGFIPITFEWYGGTSESSSAQPPLPSLDARAGDGAGVLDNLSSHHLASVRTLIEACDCTVLYLSPYSPDFNPIEMMFSKLNALVRGGHWNSVHTLFDSIGQAFQSVTRANLFGGFRHAHPSMFL
ncbi:transposase [Deinococcus altitudinis]|uniref:transposase n=1 Tax=Deinococcus altitudinis TaxID=468914 RepID=UPI00389171F8